MDDDELIRLAMQILSRRALNAKKVVSRGNVPKPRSCRKPMPLKELICTCSGGDTLTLEVHTTSCPRGRAIRRRLEMGLPLE